MKKRYLKIIGNIVWATDNLTKEDLAKLSQGGYDCILDLKEWKEFDCTSNSWLDIKGD